jgi:hypothetical protein
MQWWLFKARDLNLVTVSCENVCDVACDVSGVACDVSDVACDISGVACLPTNITSFSNTFRVVTSSVQPRKAPCRQVSIARSEQPASALVVLAPPSVPGFKLHTAVPALSVCLSICLHVAGSNLSFTFVAASGNIGAAAVLLLFLCAFIECCAVNCAVTVALQ